MVESYEEVYGTHAMDCYLPDAPRRLRRIRQGSEKEGEKVINEKMRDEIAASYYIIGGKEYMSIIKEAINEYARRSAEQNAAAQASESCGLKPETRDLNRRDSEPAVAAPTPRTDAATEKIAALKAENEKLRKRHEAAQAEMFRLAKILHDDYGWGAPMHLNDAARSQP